MRVGIVFSAFDLLHAGHIGMLREARANCDYLIVGLQTDPTIDRPTEKNKPVQTLVERYAQLNALKFVDEIVPYQTEEDVIDILELFQIDVRFLGEEYREKEFTGKDVCRKRGIELHFNKRDHRFSTSGLRKRVAAAEGETNG
jgi:glycerol-3-phosphate cytidylyltransferase